MIKVSAIASLVVLGLAGCQPKTAEAPAESARATSSHWPYVGPTWVRRIHSGHDTGWRLVASPASDAVMPSCDKVPISALNTTSYVCHPRPCPDGSDGLQIGGRCYHLSPPSEDRR